MNKNKFLEALKKAKQGSKKRNFKQKLDLIVNLKDLDLKKPEQQVEFFVKLHYSKGRESKICALVGPELATKAKSACDNVILADDFGKYAGNKKLSKQLCKDYDFFIAQADIMAKVAGAFGRVLGPKGKMPNPKAGCVVTDKTDVNALCENLKKTVKISAKTSLIIQLIIGNEEMKDEEIVDNAYNVYEQLIHHLPNEKHNVKSVFLKLTMGKPVKVL
ncbi:MAG: 50S ribosomal protein L1 [Nanoarchaeota archaeon]|nr:50S ribosomal protein L1 [Nanoarchaeota archaeon]MBU4284090.1 50S ribosomal protein L1 [Nanoarchaeota archaeon]